MKRISHAVGGVAVTGVLLIGAVGCTSVDPRKTFPAVAKDVKSRTGYRVAWATGTAEDAAVRAEVLRLLEGELSAPAAVQVALLNNPRLQAAYEDVGIAQAELVQAGLLKNPLLNASARFPTGGGTATVDVGVMFDFLQLLYIPMRKRLAAGELEVAQLAVTQKVLQTADQTRQAWVRLVSAKQNLELHQSIAAATAASADLAGRMRQAGNTTELELARQEAFGERARLGLMAAEEEAAVAQEGLALVMGVDLDRTTLVVPARLPDLPVDALGGADARKAAIAKNIELAILRNQLERLSRELGLTRPAGWLSDLELGVAFERDDAGVASVGPAVAVPLPLFSQGQPAVSIAESKLRQATKIYLGAANGVAAQSRLAARDVAASEARVERLRTTLVPLQRRITAASQLEYNGMLIGSFELLSAKQQEIEAGGMYVSALADYWLARSRLETVLAGGGFSSGMSSSRNLMQAQPAGGHE